MNKNLLILLCLAVPFLNCAQQKSIKSVDTTISWDKNIKLKWSDFQGEIDSNLFGKAKTSYKIDIIPEDVLVDEKGNIQGFEELTVEARFYKNYSWTSVPNDDLVVLKHEQLHFDIAEFFAEKIRNKFLKLQKIKEARFSIYWENYSILWKECREFQKQFDFETDHGRNIESNKVWAKKIEEGLTLLQKT